MSKNSKKKNRLYELISGNATEGRGVSKEAVKKQAELNFRNYFRMLFRRFGAVISVNLAFILCNFPAIVAYIGFLGYFNEGAPAPSSPMYTFLYSAEKLSGMTPWLAAFNGVYGGVRTVGVVTETTQALLWCGALCVFTFGFANVGLTYVMRGCVRREAVYVWSDFITGVKKNAVQGFLLGLFDSAVFLLLIFDMTYFRSLTSQSSVAVLYYVILSLFAIFLMMRPYMYVLAVTFTYKVKTIINYSFRLSMLGLARNALYLVCCLAFAYVTALLFTLNPVTGIFFPLFFAFGIVGFTGVYAAYPVALKYLLAKPSDEKPDLEDEVDYDSDDEPVFKDRG